MSARPPEKQSSETGRGVSGKDFFDFITNHTADVIGSSQERYLYGDKATFPIQGREG